MTVVTRFAPSPTGHLHIGGARTAAFCWFLARHFNGRFLLRIEDTDLERSKQEYTDSILASMKWLGLEPDEPPVYQSKRFDIYNEYIDKLIADGNAYWCNCSPEEVEAMREEARQTGAKPKYNGKCKHKGLKQSEGSVVRLALPSSGKIVFDDLFKGTISFDIDELDDMVLRKSDGAPTYNLAVVVDDITMGITHVLRGDDHVNNTPKQIAIYNALKAKLPIFAHVPMITGADKQKLSKRHGAKAVIDYEKDGLLAEGLLNYLVRLGWSHGDQEIFSIEEIIKYFDGKNLTPSSSAFDLEKLFWVNGQHLRSKSSEELLPLLKPFLSQLSLPIDNSELILNSIPLFKPRSNTLVELADNLKPLLAEHLDYDTSSFGKALKGNWQDRIKDLHKIFAELSDFSQNEIHLAINNYVSSNSLSFKEVGPVLRIALLGKLGGPDLSEVAAVLGKEETLKRLSLALNLSV